MPDAGQCHPPHLCPNIRYARAIRALSLVCACVCECTCACSRGRHACALIYAGGSGQGQPHSPSPAFSTLVPHMHLNQQYTTIPLCAATSACVHGSPTHHNLSVFVARRHMALTSQSAHHTPCMSSSFSCLHITGTPCVYGSKASLLVESKHHPLGVSTYPACAHPVGLPATVWGPLQASALGHQLLHRPRLPAHPPAHPPPSGYQLGGPPGHCPIGGVQ
eukprot:445657-Pelagomonas_calceolata.AAC.2